MLPSGGHNSAVFIKHVRIANYFLSVGERHWCKDSFWDTITMSIYKISLLTILVYILRFRLTPVLFFSLFFALFRFLLDFCLHVQLYVLLLSNSIYGLPDRAVVYICTVKTIGIVDERSTRLLRMHNLI